MDCSLPGFFVHGIFQARVLERGAIAFSVTELEWGSKLGNDLSFLLGFRLVGTGGRALLRFTHRRNCRTSWERLMSVNI